MNLYIRKILISKIFYVFLIIFTLLFFIYKTIFIKYNSKYNINDKVIKGIVTDYNIDGNVLSLMVSAKEKIKINYYMQSENEKEYYINNIKYGLTIITTGELSKPINNTIPNTFNYKRYLYNKQIFYIQRVTKIEILNNNISILYQLKNIVRKQIYNSQNRNYLLMFILGDKTLLDQQIFDNYRAIGITHLFAISGMHINFFAMIIMFILKKIKITENKRYLIVIFFLLLYSFLTNYTSSVLRSVLFYILMSLNKIFYTEITNLKLYILTVVILVFINPFIIHDLGFIYSFITCFGLIISTKYINNKNSLINLLLVSWISFLFSLPITLMNFFEINILSIINNLFYVPFVTIVLYPISLLVFIFSFFEPVLIILINISEYIAAFCAQNSLNIIIPKCSILIYLIYYFLITKCVTSINRNIYLTVAISLILVLKIYPFLNNNYEIYYLDVGQGDAILIRTPYNKENIMIDVGGKLNYKQDDWQIKRKTYHISDNVIIFLKSLGINKINTIITTHGDEDHMGEAINLVENIKVENVIFNCGEYNNLEKDLISVLDEKNINYYSCIKELNINKYKLQFLNTGVYDNENENSSVIYLNYNNYKFLFMGDAGTQREKDILDKYNLRNIDFLKVGHHGSNTSSSKEFINTINPKNSLISVGKNNRYGHPKEEILDTLKDSQIYRTDLDGTIEIKINMNGYKIKAYLP